MGKPFLTWVTAVTIAAGLIAPARSLQAFSQQSPQPAPSIAGSWAGKVTAEHGEMEIKVSLTLADGVASGTIETPHGAMTVAKGTLKDGRWTLPFSSDMGKGKMIASLKGDLLSGEWDFSPNAVGTFELTRQK